MDTAVGTCTLISTSFPDELLLKTIEDLPFDNGKVYRVLLHTHPHLASLLRTYERSITKSIIRRELRHAPHDFPSGQQKQGYAWLKSCVKGYDTIDEIMERLVDDENCVGVERHNMALVYAGLLLLYRVSSLDTTTEKLAFLTTLPLDPLTAIFLAIHHTLLTTRYHNAPSLLHHRTYGTQMDATLLSLRQDMSLAFSEACLHNGPRFLHAILYDTDAAEVALLNAYHDVITHDWDLDNFGAGELMPPATQGPLRDRDEAERLGLWVALVKRLERLLGIVGETGVEAWVVKETEEVKHRLAWLRIRERYRLVAGLDRDG